MPAKTNWTVHAEECFALQGDCAACSFPLLKLDTFKAPTDTGHYCHMFDCLAEIIEKHGTPGNKRHHGGHSKAGR